MGGFVTEDGGTGGGIPSAGGPMVSSSVKGRILLLLEIGSKARENRASLPDFPFADFQAPP